MSQIFEVFKVLVTCTGSIKNVISETKLNRKQLELTINC